ncbi:MAG: AAA family ATPase [Deltaproteobacteria bacterium]|nr:AAA family ATPase [Deltaproteobacteria bacterium]
MKRIIIAHMTQNKTIWSVGGGKGGIGKSVATANIGCALASTGKKVILVDADLGGANLHTYFGIKFPEKGLDDFLKGRVKDLGDASIETSLPNLRLISGAGEFLGIANPAYAQKMKFISSIKKLDADFIIVDLGAGSSYNVLDFFAISNEGIVMIVPEPAAIQNAYIFLKSFVYRRLQRLFSENPFMSELIRDSTDVRSPKAVKSFSDLCARIASEDRGAAARALAEVKSFRPRLILNMAASKEDLKVVEAFRAAAMTFLSMDTEFAGTLYSRPSVKAAARKMLPFMLESTAYDAHRDMADIVANLLPKAPESAPVETAEEEPVESREHEVFGFNENVSHNGTVFHVQTEAQGGGEPFIETIVYNGGRIFFSKRTLWKDAGAGDTSMKDFASRQHRAAMAAIKLDKIRIQG